MRILVDPGHSGASEPGAVGRTGLTEAEVNLAVALKVKELLQDEHEVALTRSTEIDDDGLGWRGEMADGYDCFVSIHCNASNSAEARGSEVWISKDAKSESYDLADEILFQLRNVTGVTRGVKRANFTVIAVAEDYCPACLVEMEFISHIDGEYTLANKQLELAQAIATGIVKWTK